MDVQRPEIWLGKRMRCSTPAVVFLVIILVFQSSRLSSMRRGLGWLASHEIGFLASLAWTGFLAFSPICSFIWSEEGSAPVCFGQRNLRWPSVLILLISIRWLLSYSAN